MVLLFFVNITPLLIIVQINSYFRRVLKNNE